MFRSGEREYEFVQGMAERLPFRGDAFDVVLFATSLDHIVDIRAAMREAARVLKLTGELAVWISVFDPGLHSGVMRALRRVERRAPWHPRSPLAFARVLVELVISLRFDWRDRFHLHRLELSQLRGDVAAAGLTITEQLLIHDGSQSVPHVFLRAGASRVTPGALPGPGAPDCDAVVVDVLAGDLEVARLSHSRHSGSVCRA